MEGRGKVRMGWYPAAYVLFRRAVFVGVCEGVVLAGVVGRYGGEVCERVDDTFSAGRGDARGGCEDSKPTVTGVTNAAPAPSAAMPAESCCTGARAGADRGTLIVSGPIIVEHQVELTAQRDGMLDEGLF